MTRVALLAIAYLATGCTQRYQLTEVRTGPKQTWAWHTFCPSPETLDANPHMLSDLQGALDEWQVSGWSVGSYDVLGCVPVHLVVPDASWPIPGAIGAAEFARDGQPLSLWFDLTFWTKCPSARWALVLHEVGHAVGHWEHRDGGVMSSGLGCDPGWVAVDGESLDYADARRSGML